LWILYSKCFWLVWGHCKKSQAEIKFEHILRKCKFFEMGYHEWAIEDEYEIHRIQTLVIVRDRNSRLPLKDLVWVEEASMIFL
jgi:hypothetical protein